MPFGIAQPRAVDRGMVHRLDTNTSGPLLISKTMKARGLHTCIVCTCICILCIYIYIYSYCICIYVYMYIRICTVCKKIGQDWTTPSDYPWLRMQGFEHARKQILLGLLKDAIRGMTYAQLTTNALTRTKSCFHVRRNFLEDCLCLSSVLIT